MNRAHIAIPDIYSNISGICFSLYQYLLPRKKYESKNGHKL